MNEQEVRAVAAQAAAEAVNEIEVKAIAQKVAREAAREAAREVFNDAEVKIIAREAAREAVHEVFEHFGFDVHEPREVQADMRAVRDWRCAQKQVRKVAIGTLVSILITGLCALIWTSIKGGP